MPFSYHLSAAPLGASWKKGTCCSCGEQIAWHLALALQLIVSILLHKKPNFSQAVLEISVLDLTV